MTSRGSLMTNGRYIDIENEVLRNRLVECKEGAKALVDAVRRYLRQECLRSELVNTLSDLEEKLK